MEGSMAENEDDDLTVVPLPSSETDEERQRIRESNDRDQELEREGRPSRHNQGYDEVADGAATPQIERVVDE
jgi:hypothetical protein